MKKTSCWCISIFIILNIFVCVFAAHAELKKEKVRVVFNQSYKGCKTPTICFSAETEVRNILSYADVSLMGTHARDYDVTITINIEGKAEGLAYFPGGYFYSGATLSGIISMESPNNSIRKKNFEVYIIPPAIIGIDWKPNDPCNAPFSRVFYTSGSVVSKLFEIMYDVYGVDPLIKALKDKNMDIRRRAIETLANIGKPVLEPVIAALKNEDSEIRVGSIEILGAIGDNCAVSPLIAVLCDEDPNIRGKAAKALGMIKDPSAVEPLIAILRDENKVVRWNVVRALGEIKDIGAVEPLIAVLKDKDLGARYYAKEALKNITGKDYYYNTY